MLACQMLDAVDVAVVHEVTPVAWCAPEAAAFAGSRCGCNIIGRRARGCSRRRARRCSRSCQRRAEAEAAVVSGWARRSCGSGLSRRRRVVGLKPSFWPLLPQIRLLVHCLRDVVKNRARHLQLRLVLQATTWSPPNARHTLHAPIARKAHVHGRARGCECQLKVKGTLVRRRCT